MWSVVVNVVRGRGEREEEGRSGQQSSRGNADVWSLVRLLCASALLSRNTHAGSFLLCYQGADRDREVEEERGGGWRVKEGQRRQQGTRGDLDTPSHAPLLASIFATSACARPGVLRVRRETTRWTRQEAATGGLRRAEASGRVRTTRR